MISLAVTVGIPVLWLWMTRIALRWSLEEDEWLERTRPSYKGKGPTLGHLLICLTLWWIAIPIIGHRRREMKGRQERDLIEQAVAKFAGESRWHRRQRQIEEHEVRAKELDMPVE